MSDAAKIEMLQNEIEALKRENKILVERLSAPESREQMTIRAIQGLGGVIHSVKLNHLCMMFALSGLSANFNYSRTHPKDIASDAMKIGCRLNELIEASESIINEPEIPEQIDGEHK